MELAPLDGCSALGLSQHRETARVTVICWGGEGRSRQHGRLGAAGMDFGVIGTEEPKVLYGLWLEGWAGVAFTGRGTVGRTEFSRGEWCGPVKSAGPMCTQAGVRGGEAGLRHWHSGHPETRGIMERPRRAGGDQALPRGQAGDFGVCQEWQREGE